MAYIPSINDLPEGNNIQPQQKGYTPSLADISEPTGKSFIPQGIPEAVSEVMTFNPVEKAKAFGVGAANKAADVFQGMADLPMYIMSKVPGLNKYITPEVAEKTYKENREGTALLRPQTYKPELQQTMEQNPISSTAGGILPTMAGAVGAYSGLEKAMRLPQAAGPISGYLSGLPSKVVAGGLTNTMFGNTQEEKDTAFTTGAAITGGLDVIGKGLSLAGRTGEAKYALKQKLAEGNKILLQSGDDTFDGLAGRSMYNYGDTVYKQEAQNYQKITSIPGTINRSPLYNQVKNIEKISSTKGLSEVTGKPILKSTLSSPQQQVLNSATTSLEAMQSMDDAIRLKTDLADSYKLFRKGEVATPVHTAYRELQKQVDNAIAEKAKAAGRGKDWLVAKKFHENSVLPFKEINGDDVLQAVKDKIENPQNYNKVAYNNAIKGLVKKARQSPDQLKAFLSNMDKDGSEIVERSIVQNTFSDIVSNPEATNLGKMVQNLNKEITKFDGVLSKKAVSELKGIKTLLSDLGVHEGTKKHAIIEFMLGGAVGEGIGQAIGVPSGLGSMAGVAAAPTISGAFHRMVESPAGLKILRGVGINAPWAKAVRQTIIDSLKVGPTAIMTDKRNNQ